MLDFNKGSLLSANQTDFARDSDFFTSSSNSLSSKDSPLKTTPPSKFEGTLTDDRPEPDFELSKEGSRTKEPEDYDATINLLAASLLTQAQPQPVDGVIMNPVTEEPNPDLKGVQTIESNSLLSNSAMGAKIAAPNQNLKAILSATQGTPIISFLTGDLGKIEPSQVPEVVLSSPFIADALQAGNTTQFMNQPQPLKELLGELSFPPSILQKIQAANLNPDQMITPKELFQTLGVDPKRIETELTLLQQNLPIDGLRPYMERAAALQAKAAPIVKNNNPDARSSKDPESKSTLAIPNNPMNVHPDTTIGANTSQDVGDDPLITSKKSGIPPRIIGSDKIVPQPAPVAIINDNPNLDITSVSTPPALTPISETPSDKPLNLATSFAQDPFATMKQNMDESSIASVSFTNTVSPQNTFNLNEAIAHLQTQRNASFTSNPTEKTALPQTAFMPNEIPVTNITQAPLFQMEGANSNFTQNNSLNLNLDKATISATLGRLSDILPTPEKTQSDAQDTTDQNEQKSSADTGSFIPTAIPHQNHPVSQKSEFNVGATPDTSNTNAADNIKKIMEKATLLVKDGGGSIRLDMGTKELGHIDLAVDVKDNKLSIRIIAESEQAKHLLTNELPKLRDALADQRLTLQNAEVGLRGQSNPWSHGSAQGQSGFARGQNQNQGQPTFGSEVPAPKTLSRAALPGFQPRYRSNFSQTPGQIRVLV